LRALALLLLLGCDGRFGQRTDRPVEDAFVASDSAFTFVDTGSPPPFDTRPPAPVTCAQPLPSEFTCLAPDARTGRTTCTDAMLAEFVLCFGSAGDEKRCSAAIKAFPECNDCVLREWLYDGRLVDIGACMRAIDPGSACGTNWRCNIDCLAAICSDCDDSLGSGRTSSTSERQDCERDAQFKGSSTRPMGECFDLAARDLATCRTDERFAKCFIASINDVLVFYRGACRDGGEWSRADLAIADAGADSD
jgi:hypothetical protein